MTLLTYSSDSQPVLIHGSVKQQCGFPRTGALSVSRCTVHKHYKSITGTSKHVHLKLTKAPRFFFKNCSQLINLRLFSLLSYRSTSNASKNVWMKMYWECIYFYMVPTYELSNIENVHSTAFIYVPLSICFGGNGRGPCVTYCS